MTSTFHVRQTMPATLVDIARQRADLMGDHVAFTFLEDGETGTAELTYAQLDLRARAIASQLQANSTLSQRALLLYQPGLDYIAAFLGCLYAGVVAIPTYPPDVFRVQRTLPRFLTIVEDAKPDTVLTTAAILDVAESLLDDLPNFRQMTWVATDEVPPDQASAWREVAVDANSLVFLQYTSGSTAQPKGVMLTHANLMDNLSLIHQAFVVNSDSRGYIWLPPYHDMGLIGGILGPLYSGIPVELMSPLHFLQRPLRWLEGISRTQATHSGGPNFAYDLCVRKVSPEELKTLDLRSWEVAFNGAEPIRQSTMEHFAEVFAPCGFRREAFFPCYGLAEVTVFATGGAKLKGFRGQPVRASVLAEGRVEPAQHDDARNLVSCGYPRSGHTIAIVDPVEMTRCRSDRIGEIWISGPSVAQGYWQQPDETAKTFQARLADDPQAGFFVRTGDLGFLLEGELYITGRAKDLIIADGLNHYPQDIELTVEGSHPALRAGCSAAFAVEVDDREQLVVVAEARSVKTQPHSDAGRVSESNRDDILRSIRRVLSQEHNLRPFAVELIKAGTIPKTSSGKIQRHAAKAAYQAGTLERWEP